MTGTNVIGGSNPDLSDPGSAVFQHRIIVEQRFHFIFSSLSEAVISADCTAVSSVSDRLILGRTSFQVVLKHKWILLFF